MSTAEQHLYPSVCVFSPVFVYQLGLFSVDNDAQKHNKVSLSLSLSSLSLAPFHLCDSMPLTLRSLSSSSALPALHLLLPSSLIILGVRAAAVMLLGGAAAAALTGGLHQGRAAAHPDRFTVLGFVYFSFFLALTK